MFLGGIGLTACASTPPTSLDLPEIEGSPVDETITLHHDFSPHRFAAGVTQHNAGETWEPEAVRLVPTVVDIEAAGQADLQLHEVEGERRAELIIDLDGVVFDASTDGTDLPDGAEAEQADAVARQRVTTLFTVADDTSLATTGQRFSAALYLLVPGYGPAFPAAALVPGDTWTESYTVALSGVPFDVTAEHQLLEVLDVAGRQLARVQSEAAAAETTVRYADLSPEALAAILGDEAGLTDLFTGVSVRITGLRNVVTTSLDVETGRVARQDFAVGPVQRVTSFPDDVALAFFAAPGAFETTETQEVHLLLDDGSITETAG